MREWASWLQKFEKKTQKTFTPQKQSNMNLITGKINKTNNFIFLEKCNIFSMESLGTLSQLHHVCFVDRIPELQTHPGFKQPKIWVEMIGLTMGMFLLIKQSSLRYVPSRSQVLG